MQQVGTRYRQTSKLKSVEFFPPNEHCGWFGIIVKPTWMPKWMAYLLRHKLKVNLGWLNVPCSKKPYDSPHHKRWWWIYPTGENPLPIETRIKHRAEPMFWCEIEYTGRIVDIHGKTVRKPLI